MIRWHSFHLSAQNKWIDLFYNWDSAGLLFDHSVACNKPGLIQIEWASSSLFKAELGSILTGWNHGDCI